MAENYKFFQNTKCEYFPCHETDKLEDFNCLFCFCPLYMLKDECGGNFKYSKNVKDCVITSYSIHYTKLYDGL